MEKKRFYIQLSNKTEFQRAADTFDVPIISLWMREGTHSMKRNAVLPISSLKNRELNF
jgi:hypothetical protein